MKRYSKEIYSKAVLLKAAYAFTDSMFIHLDADASDYLVTLFSKQDEDESEMYRKFENELIVQELRNLVAKQTVNLREIIVARALSSTIVNTAVQSNEEKDEFNIDEILTDWFECNG